MAAPTVPPPPPPPDPDRPWLSYPAGVYPPPPLRPVSSSSNNGGGVGAVLTLIGGAIIALASFMPWVTAFDNYGHTLSIGGLDGVRDGLITLPIGVAVVCVGVARLAMTAPATFLQRVPLLLGPIAGWIAIYDLTDIAQRLATTSYPGVYIYTGPGLYVVIVGAVVTLAGGLIVSRPPFVPPKPFAAPKPTVASAVTKRPVFPWFPAGTEAWVVGLVLVITVAVVLWTGRVLTL